MKLIPTFLLPALLFLMPACQLINAQQANTPPPGAPSGTISQLPQPTPEVALQRLIDQHPGSVNWASHRFREQPTNHAFQLEREMRLLSLGGADLMVPARPLDRFDAAASNLLARIMFSSNWTVFDIVVTNSGRLTQSDESGNNLLHYSARALRSNTLAFLLRRHPAPHSTNGSGFTPLQLLAFECTPINWYRRVTNDISPYRAHETHAHRVADAMMHHGFKLDFHSAVGLGKRDWIACQLARRPAVANETDAGGRPPLHWAVHRNQLELASMLLAAGADPNSRTPGGDTPLHWAAALLRVELTELLLRYGADVEAKNAAGVSPLHYAASSGHEPVIGLLAAAGARLEVKDLSGKTPLDYAGRHGRLVLLAACDQADASTRLARIPAPDPKQPSIPRPSPSDVLDPARIPDH